MHIFTKYLFLCNVCFLSTVSMVAAEQDYFGIDDLHLIIEQLDREATEGGVFQGYFGVLGARMYDDISTCLVVANQLGHEEMVIQIQEYLVSVVEGSISSDNPEHKRAVADWLTTLVSLGSVYSERSSSEVERVWTYECLGLTFASPFSESTFTIDSLGSGPTYANASYSFEHQTSTLRFFGEIGPGFADAFAAAVVAHPEARIIALGSSGGSISEAIIAGSIIRALGLNTVIVSLCDSACPLVFAGGVQRQLLDPLDVPLPRFHMLSVDGLTPLSPDHEAYFTIDIYLDNMGVNESAYRQWMMSAPPEADYFYTPQIQELCAANFATWVQHRC